MMTINIEFNRAFDGVIYSKVNKEYDILDCHVFIFIIHFILILYIFVGILYESRM